jgi:ketosteroid isomerase-like protein
MSHENVEVIRTAFDHFNGRDWASWEALHHDDMVVIPPKDWPDWPDAEPVYGIEAWLERVLLLLEPWHEQRLEIDALRTTGDLAVVNLRWVATGRESEIEVDMPLAGVYTITDGKIARIEFFRDPNEALEAARLRE